MGAVSQKSCGVFATPGPTLSSNSKIYIITLFSECPISFNMVRKDLLPLVWIRQLCALRDENIDFGKKMTYGQYQKFQIKSQFWLDPINVLT